MDERVLVLATSNVGKINEIKTLLAPFGITAVGARDAGFYLGIEETGETFLENATLKALTIAKALNRPALADDSGLCVEALGGKPGVMSARFAGGHASDADNNQALLLAMANQENRKASFICAMVCAKPDGSMIKAEGRLDGRIVQEARGSAGFGYDPLFVPMGESITLAQGNIEHKNQISHRARALRRIMTELPKFLQSARGYMVN